MKFHSEIWRVISLSSSGRPVLDAGEQDVFIEPNVGLYQDSYPIKHYQRGRIYLTNNRIIYVNDNKDMDSLYITYDDVEKLYYQEGFLKSNPKILITVKDTKSEIINNNIKTFTWICEVCSYSNNLSIDEKNLTKLIDLQLEMPQCNTCGVSAELRQIRDAVVDDSISGKLGQLDLMSFDSRQCPACTFLNHPSIKNCEICGHKLLDINNTVATEKSGKLVEFELETSTKSSIDAKMIKLSLRNLQDGTFFKALITANELAMRPKNATLNLVKDCATSVVTNSERQVGGLHGLSQSHSKENEDVTRLLGKSVQDMDQLMSTARDLIRISQKYNIVTSNQNKKFKGSLKNLEDMYKSKRSIEVLGQSKLKLELRDTIRHQNIIKTINRLKTGNKSKENLSKFPDVYIQELSRDIIDFVVRHNILEKNNGIVTLYEVYLLYNKFRQIDLVTPEEVVDAAHKFETLGTGWNLLRMDLEQSPSKSTNYDIHSFLYLISREGSGDSIIQKLIQYINLESGVSELHIQQYFNINIVVLKTLLDIITIKGNVLIDRTLGGTFYWKNCILELKET